MELCTNAERFEIRGVIPLIVSTHDPTKLSDNRSARSLALVSF